MEIIEQSYHEQFTLEQQQTSHNLDQSLFSLKLWWNKVECCDLYDEKAQQYEQGLQYLPGCYKLWFNYLKDSLDDLGTVDGIQLIVKQKQIERINRIFERSLIFLHKMPRIWIMYGQFMIQQKKVTNTRKIFDRALQSIPLTQHTKIWEVYIEWTLQLPNIPTVKTIMERYFQFQPDFKEDYIDYLIDKQDYKEAIVQMKKVIDDQQFVSQKDKSKYQILREMCDLISKHPMQMQGINCESIIRHGIQKYTDEVGNLWVSLAEYWLRQGLFDKARDVFEESLEKVQTVRDFGLVFDSYVRMEEEFVQIIDQNEELEEDDDYRSQVDELLGLADKQQMDSKQQELEFRIKRLERLLQRRPILLNNCLLRKNRNNVQEWINRFELLEGSSYYSQKQLIESFSQALTTIDPVQACNGYLSIVWIHIFKYYRKNGDIYNSNNILMKASQQTFKSYQDYLNIWKMWIETLIHEKRYKDAMMVVKKALFTRPDKNSTTNNFMDNIRNSQELWALYIDLEQNLGTNETIKTAYQKMLDQKVITPLVLINYIEFLEKHQYFEQSYRVFEQALSIFNVQSQYVLYINYLQRFINRYKGEKLERTRDLFEKCMSIHRKQKLVYLMYGQYEEQYGLLNHAIEIYDMMTNNIDDKYFGYQFYIAKVAQYLGVTKTRQVFEKAIQTLDGDDLVKMGVKYNQLELRLGEIDRARAVLTHISQYVSPQDDIQQFWDVFEEFENKYGNVDTYKDYLRIKRAVSIKFQLNPPDVKRILEKFQEDEQNQQVSE